MFESSIFVGAILVGLGALIVWDGRCTKCGKWFAFDVESRTLLSEGYHQRWVSVKESPTQKLKSVYEYSYQEEKVCCSCGYRYTKNFRASGSRPCGRFKTSWETSSGSPREEENSPRIKAKGGWKLLGMGVLLLTALLIIGFPLFDLDVLRYPSHWHTYLDNYVESIIKPFGKGEEKIYLEVTGENWKICYAIERYSEKGWQKTGEKTLAGSSTEGSPQQRPRPPLAKQC